MIFRAPEFDNSHNITAPPFAPIPWDSVATIGERCAATAIGPHLLSTSAELEVQVGETVGIQGLAGTVTSIIRSDTCNTDYLITDLTIPIFVPIYRGTPYSVEHDLLVIGSSVGVGRGNAIMDGTLLVGWTQGDPSTAAKRWGMNKLSGVIFPVPSQTENARFWGNFENPFSDSVYVCDGDRGAGAFILINGIWTSLGPVDYAEFPTAVFNVLQKGAWGQFAFKDFPLIDAINNPTSPTLADPQTVRVDSPPNDFHTTNPQVNVSGSFVGFPDQILVNGVITERLINPDQLNGYFNQMVTLTPGSNVITIDINYPEWMPLHYLASVLLNLDVTAPTEPPVFPPATPISINLEGTVHIAGKAYPIKYTAAIDKLPS